MHEKEPILISGCLLGLRCRYDGEKKPLPEAILKKLAEAYYLIPVCPEQLGGLPTPRVPAERQGNRLITQTGKDVTDAYQKGAEEVLSLAKRFGCKRAILKEKSPACGHGKIYDGSFRHILTDGNGVAAGLLLRSGVTVIGESELFD